MRYGHQNVSRHHFQHFTESINQRTCFAQNGPTPSKRLEKQSSEIFQLSLRQLTF